MRSHSVQLLLGFLQHRSDVHTCTTPRPSLHPHTALLGHQEHPPLLEPAEQAAVQGGYHREQGSSWTRHFSHTGKSCSDPQPPARGSLKLFYTNFELSFAFCLCHQPGCAFFCSVTLTHCLNTATGGMEQLQLSSLKLITETQRPIIPEH